jgi:hypothetical protein
MYSGTTLTRFSGRAFGAHQKIDSVARRHLTKLVKGDKLFPPIRQILHFEGKNGPDGTKRKSPARDEPWHFFAPFNDEDAEILGLIQHHYNLLVEELKEGDQERAAFEAAWLAHAIVDGLTPAHHYPFEQKLAELRGGEGNETRTSVRKKMVMPGKTRREKVTNNWKMWGAKGLLITHWWFEFGIAMLIKPLNFGEAKPTRSELKHFMEIGLDEAFKRTAREIAVLDMYDVYYKKGWTPKLAYQVRHKLGPALVRTVTLAWYAALCEAGLIQYEP